MRPSGRTASQIRPVTITRNLHALTVKQRAANKVAVRWKFNV
jgi:hypothetical protein